LTRAEAQGHDDKTIDLDQHRGMAADEATDLRRLLAEVEANERSLCQRQDELESHLVAAPAASWHEAAEKTRYLLNLFSATPAIDFVLLCRSTVGFDRTLRARSRRQ
jgi:hypothetical protein